MSYPQKENDTIHLPPCYKDSVVPHSFESYPTDPAQQPLVTNNGQLVPPAGQSYPLNASGQPQPGGPIDGTQGYPNQYYPPQHGGYQKQAHQPRSDQNTSTTVIDIHPNLQPLIVPSNIPSYCLLSWLSFLCCFSPFGFCAIVKSSKVANAIANNDIEGAREASDDARRLVFLSIGTSIAAITFYTLFMVFVI